MSTRATGEPAVNSAAAFRAKSGEGLRSFIDRTYGLDLRSLALFRVTLALVLLGDLYMRSWDLRAFYTDFGVLPRSALIERFSDRWIISLHLMSGQWQVQALLFVIAAGFALMMLFGWRTRLATIASWVMLASLHNRNPAVLQGGDTLLRMLVFWAMFLPLGAVYSVDSGLDPDQERPKPLRIFSAGSVGLMLQIAALYWFAVLLKTGPEWRHEGSAVYYALSLEQMATPLGRWLLHFPMLVKFLSFFTLVVEALAPVFLFFPVLAGPVRTVAVLFLVGLQLGFGTCLSLGHFPFVASAMMMSMLPSWFWEFGGIPGADRRARSEQRSLKIYYDGDCGFCKKMSYILRALALRQDTPLLTAQSEAPIHEQMIEQRSWVVVDTAGKAHYRTDALAVLLSHSHIFLWRWIGWGIGLRPVQVLGDIKYRWVEQNRSRLSRWTSFLSYRPVRWKASALANAVGVFFILYMLWWNVSTVRGDPFLPVQYRWVGVSLRVDQVWDMFAPGPLRDDGWYVIKGTLRNGEVVDIFRDGAPVTFARPTPDKVAAQYKDERWRKYLLNLYTETYAPWRLYYGRYLCRKWNEGKNEKDPRVLDNFEIYFVMRSNTGVGIASEPKPWMMHRHFCWR